MMNAIAEPLEFVDDVHASMLLNQRPDPARNGDESEEAMVGAYGERVLAWMVDRICAIRAAL